MFLSIEHEEVGPLHTNNDIGRGHILFDLYKSKIDSNNCFIK